MQRFQFQPCRGLTTRRNTRPSRPSPPRKSKSGFDATPLRSKRSASLIASYRIIEPIHSREYAHLIDSHCCRSFIASATDCIRLPKLFHLLALVFLSLSLSLLFSLLAAPFFLQNCDVFVPFQIEIFPPSSSVVAIHRAFFFLAFYRFFSFLSRFSLPGEEENVNRFDLGEFC